MKNMKLIAIKGYKGVGKSTVANMVSFIIDNPLNPLFTEFIKYRRSNRFVFNIADPVKRAASATFGIELRYMYDEEYKDVPVLDGKTPRDLMKYVAEGTISFIGDKQFWAKQTLSDIKDRSLLKNHFMYVVGDLRKPEEDEYLRANVGEYFVIEVANENITKDYGIAEQNTDMIKSDATIVNGMKSKELLFNEVLLIMKQLGYVGQSNSTSNEDTGN